MTFAADVARVAAGPGLPASGRWPLPFANITYCLMITHQQEPDYIRLAETAPEMLCREAPPEILEACALDNEPTPFLERFFEAGIRALGRQRHGRELPQLYVNNAIVVLWLRACRLYTNGLLGIADPDGDKGFFDSADATPT